MEVCLGDKVHLLKETRQLVVKTRNKLVHRFKLVTMVQGGDEHIASFETRLKLVARTGRFQVEGLACKEQTDYTKQMVLDNLIRGLAEEEIKRKVLATPETECTLAKVLRFVEAKESGKYSLSDSNLFDSDSGVSTFKRQQQPGGCGQAARGEPSQGEGHHQAVQQLQDCAR